MKTGYFAYVGWQVKEGMEQFYRVLSRNSLTLKFTVAILH